MTESTDNVFATIGAALRAGKPAPAPGARGPRVLVATDFSPVAEAAVDAALDLAAELGARLEVLHILSIAPITHADFVWVPTPEEVERMTQQSEQALAETLARLRKRETSVEIETKIRHGIVPEDILATITADAPDLVVIGTHGRGFWSSLLLGSVARTITRDSPAPVVCVPAGGFYTKGGCVLVPVELGRVSEAALDLAAGIASVLGARLRLLYVFPGPEGIEHATGKTLEERIARDAQGALERLAGPERASDLVVESATRFGRPARQIAEEAKACQAAIVVMGTHRRGFVERAVEGSVSADVIHISTRPVLTVWDSKGEG